MPDFSLGLTSRERVQPRYGALPGLETIDRARRGWWNTKHGASDSGVKGCCLNQGATSAGHGGQEKCFAGREAVRTVCGISSSSSSSPSSSLSPLQASLPTHKHPASQMVTLTHSCCRFLWFRPCSTHPGLDSGSGHVPLSRLSESQDYPGRETELASMASPTRLTQLLTALLRRKERAMWVSGPFLLRIHCYLHWGLGGGTVSHGTSKTQETETLRSQSSVTPAALESLISMGDGGRPYPKL